MLSVVCRHFRKAAPRRSAIAIFAGLILTLPGHAGGLASLPDGGTDDALASLAQSVLSTQGAEVTVIAEAMPADIMRESVRPQYPEMARRQGVEGYVVVQFNITKHGTVTDARVLEAQPANYFETAAIDAVRQFQFSPAESASDPVAIRGAINRFVFSLRAPGSPAKPGFILHRGRTYFAMAQQLPAAH